MSTSTSTPEVAFPYEASEAAHAVKAFFALRVRVSDPKMSGDTSTPELHQRICDFIASAVSDRLYTFCKGEPYGENEEIEFVFKAIGDGSRTFELTVPYPVVKDIEYRFHGAKLYLKHPSYKLAATDGTYVLRASRRLVTFGGNIVWHASTE